MSKMHANFVLQMVLTLLTKKKKERFLFSLIDDDPIGRTHAVSSCLIRTYAEYRVKNRMCQYCSLRSQNDQ